MRDRLSLLSTEKPSPRVRAVEVVGLALIAFAVATVMGEPKLGLFLAAAVVVCELLANAGALAFRSVRSRTSAR